MIYLKGSGFTNAATVKEIRVEQKDYSHYPKKCYYCSAVHENKTLHCGNCKKPEKLEHPTIILKGNDFTRSTNYFNNNVDKETGQVVERR